MLVDQTEIVNKRRPTQITLDAWFHLDQALCQLDIQTGPVDMLEYKNARAPVTERDSRDIDLIFQKLKQVRMIILSPRRPACRG